MSAYLTLASICRIVLISSSVIGTGDLIAQLIQSIASWKVIFKYAYNFAFYSA